MTIEETTVGEVSVISMHGDADLAAVPAIQEKLHAKMRGDDCGLVLDFSNTSFVNTPVWALVVEFYQHTLTSGSSFALAGMTGRVLASFEIVRLGEFVSFFGTVEEAAAHVA
jgi:anti-anti-sigma factor